MEKQKTKKLPQHGCSKCFCHLGAADTCTRANSPVIFDEQCWILLLKKEPLYFLLLLCISWKLSNFHRCRPTCGSEQPGTLSLLLLLLLLLFRCVGGACWVMTSDFCDNARKRAALKSPVENQAFVFNFISLSSRRLWPHSHASMRQNCCQSAFKCQNPYQV